MVLPRRWWCCKQMHQLTLCVHLLIWCLSRPAHAAVSVIAAAQQRAPFMTVALSNVRPAAETRYDWTVSTRANQRSITVPVDSNKGWPQLQYTVSYTRSRQAQTVYTLSGSVVVSTKDSIASAINLPNITVTTQLGAVYQMPSEAIQCPSLVVAAGSQLTCSFAASYSGPQPLPGSISASVSLAGTLIPIDLQAAPVQYDFSGAEPIDAGAFATASNYFEMGNGILQPYGVYGEQPPPGLMLEDSRVFKFTAVFGGVSTAKCGSQWKAVNTAELTPSGADGSSKGSNTQQSVVVVSISLSGCEGGFQEAPTQPTAPPTAWWPPAATPPAATVPPPAAAPPPAIPGITFAEAGSTLCGTGVCPRGQRCFDGWNCCPENTPICGGSCCQAPNVCVSNKCVPPGGVPCGTTVCPAGQVCGEGNVCCAADRPVCGGACCAPGQTCLLGVCAAAGSVACGITVCVPGQTCVSGICCALGETACGGRCCAAGNVCLQGQFCSPAGSAICGNGQICQAPQQCAGGMLCCDTGASFCGGACCPVTSTCQANRCLQPGQTLCGATTVCGIGQTCQGGLVCCNEGATFCNNACCAQGLTCINNQCVATGSVACGPTVCPPDRVCGNTQTGLCCQSIQQFGCGTNCCNTLTQVCNQFTQQCTERFNTACGAGQQWCPGANMCCPTLQICAFNQCLPRNAIGRRLHSHHHH